MANEKMEFDIVVNGVAAKNSIKDVEKAQDDLERRTVKSASIILSSWVKIGAAVTGAAFSMKKALDAAKDIDTLETKLKVATKSSELMRSKFDELSTVSDVMGLSLESLAGSYAKFKIASDLAGTSATDTEKIFYSVATASSAMKLSADETEGVFKALEQMMSKGTVQTEELKGQLGERLPGAFSLAAKAMGVTTAELGKMLEQGQVMASDMLPKLADELNKTFAEGAVDASNSLQASYNRLGNSFTNLKGVINQTLKNLGIIEYFSSAVKKVEEFTGWLWKSSKALEEMNDNERGREKIELQTKINALTKEMADRDSIFSKVMSANRQREINILSAKLKKLDELEKKLDEETKQITDSEKTKTDAIQKANADSIKSKKAEEEAIKRNKLAVKEAEAAERERLSSQKKFSNEYLEVLTNQTEYELSQLGQQYEEYSKYIEDKAQLNEWFDKRSAEIIANSEETKAREEQAENALEIQDEFSEAYLRSLMSDKEFELTQLAEKYNEFAKHVEDKAALDEWFSNETKRILKEDEKATDEYKKLKEETFDSLTNSFMEFAKTGKLSFTDMANSIIADLLRIQVQKAVVSAVTGIGGFLGFHTGTAEVKHTGGAVGGGSNIPSYHTGTSNIRGDERLAKLQVGEAVVNRTGTQNNKEAINEMNKGKKIKIPDVPSYHTGFTPTYVKDEQVAKQSVSESVVNQTSTQGAAESANNSKTINQGNTVANITFEVKAIDSASFNQYLVKERNTIENIINKSISTNGSVNKTIKQSV